MFLGAYVVDHLPATHAWQPEVDDDAVEASTLERRDRLLASCHGRRLGRERLHELEYVISLHLLVLDHKNALCAGSVRRCTVENRDPLSRSVVRRRLRSAGGDPGAVVGASVA